MFSKKHIKKIAEVLKTEKEISLNMNELFRGTSLSTLNRVTADLATMLQQDNPNFDRRKFYTACDYYS